MFLEAIFLNEIINKTTQLHQKFFTWDNRNSADKLFSVEFSTEIKLIIKLW